MASSASYLQYWGLADRPFEDTRNPRYFYASTQHEEALARLLYVVEEGNIAFGMLTGEIGSGKTLTAVKLHESLASSRYEVVYLENADLSFPELLCEILLQVGELESVPGPESPYLLRRAFKEFLEREIVQKERAFVLILDEAQQLSSETLVKLRNLTNIEGRSCARTHVTIILVGQPELRGLIKHLPQLEQRIALRYHLNPLDERSLGEYLQFRARAAGHQHGTLFAPEAVKAIFHATGGIPREINRIVKLALDRSYFLRERAVSLAIIEEIITDLREQEGDRRARRVAGA